MLSTKYIGMHVFPERDKNDINSNLRRVKSTSIINPSH